MLTSARCRGSALLSLIFVLTGCEGPTEEASCTSQLDATAALLDTHDYALDPELTELDGVVVIIDRYDDGHPRQLGLSIAPTIGTFWTIEGRELVWLADGELARRLEGHVGSEVRVRGVLREGHSLLRAMDLRAYEMAGETVMLPGPESIVVDVAVEGIVAVVERSDDGHPLVLGIAQSNCAPVVLAATNKSRELRYRIGRRVRIEGGFLDPDELTVVSYEELDGQPLVRAGDGFRVSFLAGGQDENGGFMGGVEIDTMAAFDGKIFAGSSYRKNTQEGSPDPPPPGAQVLVLDRPDGRWRIDFEVPVSEAGNAPRMIFFDVVRFETDHEGNPLVPPVEMLAAVSGNGEIYLRRPGEPPQWVATGIRAVVAAVAGSDQRPDARSVVSYTDAISGISYLFVGAGVGRAGEGGGIYKGAYDASLPGLIAWAPGREVEIPNDRPNPRVMGFVEADESLYASVGAQLLRRQDGVAPSWEEILFLPNPLPFRGDSLRKPSALRGANGGSSLLLGAEGTGSIVRVDIDAEDTTTNELTLQSRFPESTYTIVAYDGPVRRSLDGGGDAAILGFEMTRVRRTLEPEPDDFDLGRVYEFTDGLFLWRDQDGSYWMNRVVDSTLEVAPPLVAPRAVLAHSPFAGEESVIYFGGFDHNGHLFHNTGWIFKVHLEDLLRGAVSLSDEQPD